MIKRAAWKKVAVAAIKITLSVAILTWLFYRASTENQFAEVATAPKNWFCLAAAFVLVFLAHLISFIRWWLLVTALKIPFSISDAARIGFVGSFFGLFAFGVVGGDSLRVFYATRNARNKLPEVICSVFLDRAIGMLVMFSYASVGFLFVDLNIQTAPNPEQLQTIRFACTMIAMLALCGWICGGLLMLIPQLLRSPPILMAMRIPKIGSLFEQLILAIEFYRHKKTCLALCLTLSLFVNLCFVGAIYWTAVGINVEHPPWSQHFIIAPFSLTANAVPLPGGVGGMEFVLSFFYDAMSQTQGKTEFGIVVAFTVRLLLLSMAVIGSIAWFFSRKQIDSAVVSQTNSSSADRSTS